jgi:hypothetical protein
MTRSRFRPQVTQLEDRCTLAGFSFWAGLGGGASAVRLFVFVEHPPSPIMPEVVTVTEFLPNGDIVTAPPNPCRIATNAITANMPLHLLFNPGAVRGLLEAAHVNSAAFIPPSGGGGNGP